MTDIFSCTLMPNNFRNKDKEPSHVLYKTKKTKDENGNYTIEEDNVVKLPNGTRINVAGWVRDLKNGGVSVYIQVEEFNEERKNLDTFEKPKQNETKKVQNETKVPGFEDMKDDIPF